jgi:hypothetical protein
MRWIEKMCEVHQGKEEVIDFVGCDFSHIHSAGLIDFSIQITFLKKQPYIITTQRSNVSCRNL